MGSHAGAGIALHEDDTSDGLYGFAGNTALSCRVLEPALAAASAVLPRNVAAITDGFLAENGIIGEGCRGIPSAPPEQGPKALEVVFETPTHAPQPRRAVAGILAVKSIRICSLRKLPGTGEAVFCRKVICLAPWWLEFRKTSNGAAGICFASCVWRQAGDQSC